MRVSFPDKSYVECRKGDDGKIILIISAKDAANPNKRICNAVEITTEEFKKLMGDIQI